MADMAVHIVDHDAQWQEKFAQQRDLLSPALSSWLAAPIEHVGSTAVPDLAAKPIIDILAPVISLAEAQGAVPLLQHSTTARHIRAARSDVKVSGPA